MCLHQFYHKGQWVGNFMRTEPDPETPIFNTEAGVYCMSLKFGSYGGVLSASIGDRNGVLLDEFRYTNGVFYPVANAVLDRAHAKGEHMKPVFGSQPLAPAAYNRRGAKVGIATGSSGQSKNRRSHSIQAGGPASYVEIADRKGSNREMIAIVSRNDWNCVFRVTNQEPHGILVWNVRVQTKSHGLGTDDLGWDTVADDYPSGESFIAPGRSGEFQIKRPYLTNWRICVLYSADLKNDGQAFYGNYEVISPEQEE